MHEDEAGFEASIGVPGTSEGHHSSSLRFIIFWMDIEEASLTNAASGRVFCDRSNVPDVEAVAVVALVEIAIVDILVVIDGASSSSKISRIVRVFQVADIENVGLRLSAMSQTTRVMFQKRLAGRTWSH